MATIIGTNGNDTRTGTAGPDTMIGRAGHDQLSGLGGNDRLNGGTQNDLLNGGTGSDTADYSNIVIGGTTYTGATAGVTVNLNLVGAQKTGGAGSDTLVSMENLIGTTVNDTLTGNGTNNMLSGLAGNDTLTGGSGNDQLFGDSGNDTLRGDNGNDLLNGGAGADTMNGGNGNDTYIVDNVGDKAVESLNTALGGIDTVQSSVTRSLGFGLENLTLTGAAAISGTGNGNANVLTGNGFNNVLSGLDGNDTLNSLGGNDQLFGGNGDDTLTGGTGNDFLDGGAGSDTASYATATAGVTVGIDDVFGGHPSGEPQNTGGAGIDTLLNIENLTGSNFNDTLSIVGLDNTTLNGRKGNDTLYADHSIDATLNGEAGNDHLFYGNGFGTLNGGVGDDHLVTTDGGVLNGGAGNDVLEAVPGMDFSILNGGGGADTLSGFFGDTFNYNAVSDSPTGVGRDKILHFQGEGSDFGEQIDLTDVDANALVGGNQAFTFIGAAAFTTAGQLRYAGGILSGSTDGDTLPEFEIQLIGAPALFVQAGHPGTDILL